MTESAEVIAKFSTRRS